MPRIKRAIDYPRDGPLKSGRVFGKVFRGEVKYEPARDASDERSRGGSEAGSTQSGDPATSDEREAEEEVADTSDSDSELSDLLESEAEESGTEDAESDNDDGNSDDNDNDGDPYGDHDDYGDDDNLNDYDDDANPDDYDNDAHPYYSNDYGDGDGHDIDDEESEERHIKTEMSGVNAAMAPATPVQMHQPLESLQVTKITLFVPFPSQAHNIADKASTYQPWPGTVPSTTPSVTSHSSGWDRSDRSRGNGNTQAYRGAFLKAKWYTYQDADIMNGLVWTEEYDLLHWHLKGTLDLSQKACSRYLFPFDEGACQNRWQRMKEIYSALKGEELAAAIAAREEMGRRFAEGQFDHRIEYSLEEDRELADLDRKERELEFAWPSAQGCHW
ncbi:hypothetical protein V8F20_011290 [Naviculisporaceae sp. PSN 640]